MATAAESLLPRHPSSLNFYGITQAQTKIILIGIAIKLINELNIILFTKCYPFRTWCLIGYKVINMAKIYQLDKSFTIELRVIDQQRHFRRLANHRFLDFRFCFVGVKRSVLHIQPFTAHYHNINVITTDNFLSDSSLQRQRIFIQFTAGRNNVNFRLRQFVKSFRRVG
ncbi:hypothetical protein MTE2_4665 [Klebsiella pneumoniae VA360]|nr:hypothetical protein MTE2_4665 [Klebsiella pneumoniae VA360]